jgi:hypothetical protein
VGGKKSLQLIFDTSIAISARTEGTVTRQKRRPATTDFIFVTIRTPELIACAFCLLSAVAWHQSKLANNRSDMGSWNKPKLISNFRRDSVCDGGTR